MLPILFAAAAAVVAAAAASTPAGPHPAAATHQPAPSSVAGMRDAMRDACSKLRGTAPETATTRAAFKRCVAQIRYDGDLPAEKPRTR